MRVHRRLQDGPGFQGGARRDDDRDRPSLPPGLDADAALASLDQAISVAPENAVYYSNRATVYRDAKKDYPRALADYDKAIELAPGLSQLY